MQGPVGIAPHLARLALRRAGVPDGGTVRTTLSAPLPAGDGWHLLERRPDVRQAERELQAATLETDIVRAHLYPKVSFGASLTSSDMPLKTSTA